VFFSRVEPDLIFYSNFAGARFGRICIFKSGRGHGPGPDFIETTYSTTKRFSNWQKTV